MEEMKGIFKRKIFSTDAGYIVGLFRIKEIEKSKDMIGKTITFVGYFHELTEEDNYLFRGEFIEHDKYGKQFRVDSYEKPLPEEKDSIVEFLSSGIFKGIGEKKAQKIVDVLGKDSLAIILENPENLLLIPTLTKKQVDMLHNKLVEYQASYKIVLKLNDLGFSTKDSMLIYNKYQERTLKVVEENIYQPFFDIDKLSFKKLDTIARNSGIDKSDIRRIRAMILYVITEVCNIYGHSYLTKREIYQYTSRLFGASIELAIFEKALQDLFVDIYLVLEEDRYYLKEMYEAEENIVKRICYLTRKEDTVNKMLEQKVCELEKNFAIFYNEEQRKAIMEAYKKNFLVITGGPGTGKTTIIKGIVGLYKEINRYPLDQLQEKIALLAPTGRASKRISESAMISASTIHRFLKWNKDNNKFQVNEKNKSTVELVIVDEASMIDTYLLDHLLKGLKIDCKIILVGDDNQLPSVGPGQVLKDIIESNVSNVIKLQELYRQSQESYIIKLAYDINQDQVDINVLNQKDAIFIPCPPNIVKEHILKISKEYLEENYKKFQVLAPMYRGGNGIDEINLQLQEVFNPKDSKRSEITINNVVFRVNDKVIQLTNMPEDNVFNGDIGIIKQIKNASKKELVIDFDGNEVIYHSSDFNNFKHAYAISIHKSQGSEFDTVIIPIVKAYGKMLYRKLIYTGVTRAKKKLYLIGEIDSLLLASHNNDSELRKTTICSKLIAKM